MTLTNKLDYIADTYPLVGDGLTSHELLFLLKTELIELDHINMICTDLGHRLRGLDLTFIEYALYLGEIPPSSLIAMIGPFNLKDIPDTVYLTPTGNLCLQLKTYSDIHASREID